jgi:site-specific DNA-cytosine methylase
VSDRWQTILAIDFDRWAAETYRANFPGVRVECGPVADFIDALPGADVVLGGPPCQPFSDAGENEGEADARDCIPDFVAAVRRVRPRQFLMENVRGLLKERHLRYFGRVLAELESLGYAVEWRLLDAVAFGVPQFRERVWVWGIRRDVADAGARHGWPKPTHAWPPPEPCMFGAALLPGVTVGQALGIDAIYDGYNDAYRTGPAPTIHASMTKAGAHGLHAVETGGVTSTPWNYRESTAGANLDPGAIEYRWSDAMLTKHPPASPASPAPTVQAKWFKGGAEGLLDITGIRCPRGKGMCDRAGERRDHPLTEPCPTIGANIATGGGAGLMAVRSDLRVRRLTPQECARLQSVPDSFVWPDKVTKTAMYRIVGNGWACGMAARMSEALAAADPGSRTVIDLFCGGGLGACGWHGRYWTYETAGEVAA